MIKPELPDGAAFKLGPHDDYITILARMPVRGYWYLVTAKGYTFEEKYYKRPALKDITDDFPGAVYLGQITSHQVK